MVGNPFYLCCFSSSRSLSILIYSFFFLLIKLLVWGRGRNDRLIRCLLESFFLVIANSCNQDKLDDLIVVAQLVTSKYPLGVCVSHSVLYCRGGIGCPLMSCAQFVRENNPFAACFVRWKDLCLKLVCRKTEKGNWWRSLLKTNIQSF